MQNTGLPKPKGKANPIDTDYEIGQDNIQKKYGPMGIDIHNPVFWISALVITFFVVMTLVYQDNLASSFSTIRSWLTTHLAWFFLSAGNLFVVVCLLIVLSPLGKVRIGGTQASPDFSYPSWFAMLFAAGMGIGLMFYGVAEPITHFSSALTGSDWAPLDGAMGNPEKAQSLAMAATIFHWGLHPWAIYAIVALSLALFAYNKGLPLTLRSVFYPVLGDRIWGWPGHLIDILAVFATIFGLATSLGFGAEQAGSGLAHLFGTGDAQEGTRSLFGVSYGNTTENATNSKSILVFLILGITAIAIVSVCLGVDKGVKRLSEANILLALALLGFTLFVGPTTELIKDFFTNIWSYLRYLLPFSNPFSREDINFSQGWTAFYWAWWVSWSPFVGMFIARVSRGRSVREFIICALLVPSLVSVLWMTVFGGTAIQQIVDQGVTTVQDATLELQLFKMLELLPLADITSFIAIVLVLVFFITSSDSGSLVIDSITAGGKVDAPKVQRVFWATVEALLAIALLLGGGLTALQAAVVSTGAPFTLLLLLATYCMLKCLLSEPRGR